MKTIEELQEQNQALAAHTEVLRTVIKSALIMLVKQEDTLRSSGRDEPNAEPDILRCEDALSETPQQHLAELLAEAGRNGFLEGVRQMAENEIGWFGHDADSCANHYANSVRIGKPR